jgi:predicted  nucleic acid-binding Zn-ribbon protein
LLYNAEEALDQPLPPAGDGWEAVTFPGQLPLAHTVELAETNGWSSATTADGSAEVTSSAEPAPEDLVQLIQDLNQCNDALLLRVTELEEALERSQVALQAEIERTQTPPGGLPVGATPGPVQQQIAQLLSELDIANDGLRRTTIHNETLQADLEANQQRVAQLERECTLLQQRFGEKNTALHQAEETCRDLKARLHRQQRYTLQFKAALEKCLNMAPTTGQAVQSSTTAMQGQLLSPTALEEAGQPVAMPRSQQIQPWSAGTGSVTDNPSLTHLLRGLRGAGPSPVPAPAAIQPDLFTAPEPSPAIAPEPLPTMPTAPLPPASPAPVALDPWLEEASPTAATATAAEAASLFTEPSPWGEPVAAAPQPTAAPQSIPTAMAAPAEPVRSPQAPIAAPASRPAAPTLPAYPGTAAKASPSPLVYPLRSQKKITSIAAVELPSFGRAVQRRTV